MKKKVLLMTAISLLLLGVVIAAALNAVFTVTDVVVNFGALSSEGEAESYVLQDRLDDELVGRSTTFLSLDDVRLLVAEYPAFKVTAIEKEFPRTVVLSVEERKETFAFRRADGTYAVLDEEGIYLYDKPENVNRRSGGNITLEGFALETPAAGEKPSGAYFEAAMKFVSVFLDAFDDLRTNIRFIRLVETENPFLGDYFFRVQMQEGVVVDILNPAGSTEEKAREALNKYLSLSDVQRLYGYFDVIDLAAGGVSASEHRAEIPN